MSEFEQVIYDSGIRQTEVDAITILAFAGDLEYEGMFAAQMRIGISRLNNYANTHSSTEWK